MHWLRILSVFFSFLLIACPEPSESATLEKTVSLVTGQPIGDLAVAGRLSIDLHAAFMASRTYDHQKVLNWYNCGYSGGGRGTKVGGDFGDFGFQVPAEQRDSVYPSAVTIGEIPAIHFDGKNWLKGNFDVEPNIAGKQYMALELWLRLVKPAPGSVVLEWESKDGKENSAQLVLPPMFKSSDQWRHLVINCTPELQRIYLDGKLISQDPRTMIIQSGHHLVLGGIQTGKPALTGDLAAVRLHDRAMSQEQIEHNFTGGAMLGTEMHDWWRTEPNKWFRVQAEHFTHCIDKQEMEKWTPKQLKEFYDRLPTMIHLAELVYHTYSERLALRVGVVSRLPEQRGDGIKYRIPIEPTTNGSWAGYNESFGWCCQQAGFINPHELVHGCQSQTGSMIGTFWETHANFPQTYNGIYQTMPLKIAENSAFPSNGRVYYADRLMFEHLAQTEAYGPMFISKLWYDGPSSPSDKQPYPWKVFSELNPPTPLADEWLRMSQRTITWDYTTFVNGFADGKLSTNCNTTDGNDGVPSTNNLYLKLAQGNQAGIQRYARIVMEQIPYDPDKLDVSPVDSPQGTEQTLRWWRVPKEQAPQQLGWNIIPLSFKLGAVSATLKGYENAQRGSRWRAGFVGVDHSGKPVYGKAFGPGKPMTFQAGSNLKELYLVVCAVPSNMMAIPMTGDFRSQEQEQFPYRVLFTGCEPSGPSLIPPVQEAGTPHPNGGGFVGTKARVEPSAYVGPDARVLGSSKVLGNARIEDFAVVQDSTVQDEAIVSGHSLVTENSVVAGNARVRDYATVKKQSTIKDHARILEHATLASQKTCGGYVTIKGIANVYGGNQQGTAMIDGFYAKGNEIKNGKWLTWSWGLGKNPGESDEDFDGVYADYNFQNPHPWMARDDFGATWGYLVGSPQIVTVPLHQVFKSTLLKTESVSATLDRNPDRDIDYAEMMTGYVEPAETGKYVFMIAADDEGELWIGDVGSSKADKKICSNPFFAPFRDYKIFPTQKSAPMRLEKGKRYPIKVLHSNAHMMGSLSVSWSLGGGDPVPIPTECFYTEAIGTRHGVLHRIWGNVSSVDDLMKRPDYPSGTLQISGNALNLNGVNQFVELPRDIADLHDCSYTVEFQSNGNPDGTILYEFANPNGDSLRLYFVSGGIPIFEIKKGSRRESLTGPLLRPGSWNTIRIRMNENGSAMFVNGQKVAENTSPKLWPEDIRATTCYLGRGSRGAFFKGFIGRFTIHTRSQEM
jgi:hypothetical protein